MDTKGLYLKKIGINRNSIFCDGGNGVTQLQCLHLRTSAIFKGCFVFPASKVLEGRFWSLKKYPQVFGVVSSAVADSTEGSAAEDLKLFQNLSKEEQLLISRLKEYVLHSGRVIRLLCVLKRADFIPSSQAPYTDMPQLIGFNATISAPHMHALCLELLNSHLLPGNKALDIGSGSGFLTAAFGMLVAPHGKAFGVDHIEELIEFSVSNVKRSSASKLLKDGVISFCCYDGRMGFPSGGPYNAIHIGAAVDSVPKCVIEQLACGGRLLAPIGRTKQELWIIDKGQDGKLSYHSVVGVQYIPLTDEETQRDSHRFNYM